MDDVLNLLRAIYDALIPHVSILGFVVQFIVRQLIVICWPTIFKLIKIPISITWSRRPRFDSGMVTMYVCTIVLFGRFVIELSLWLR